MKTLLFSLLLFPLAANAFKGDFTYHSMVQMANGTDNFTPGHYTEKDKQGSIQISHSSITIDGKLLRLRPTDDRKIYKTKGGIVKFFFEDNELVAVHLAQYNRVYHFHIASEQTLASSEKPELVTEEQTLNK